MSGRKNSLLFYGLSFLAFFATPIFADGSLTVKTDPDGIEVWLDDKFVGDSPIFDKKLKGGRYSLKLIDPVQHSSIVEEIFIQENETTLIEKTIKSKYGTLKVQSDPEGAQVFISTELGNTPVSNDFMNPGKYRVEIRHPNSKYDPVIENIVIPRGESVSLSKTLEKEEILTKKAKLRLILGAITAGGVALAIIEHSQAKKYESEKARFDPLIPAELEAYNTYKSKYNSATALKILGIVGGSASLIGLEIVAFF